jgi:hypothetical protein
MACNNFKLGVMMLAVSALIAGCGGSKTGPSATLGGIRSSSSDNPAPPMRTGSVTSVTSRYSTPTLAGTVDPLVGTSSGYAITVIKSKDINADGVDEVVIGGRHSMTFTPATHQHNQMHIFGWNNNPTQLTNETTTWFSGNDNIIVGTEPSIKFGNFTGQTGNQLDMFVAGGTDNINVLAPSIIFKNNGNNTFTRINLAGSSGWAHGSDIGDINGDGISDMITTGYNNPTTILGGATPTVLTNNGLHGGDSVTVGEFLGRGSGTYALITNGTVTPVFQKFNPADNTWSNQSITVNDTNAALAVTIPFGRHTIGIQAIAVNSDGLQDFVMVSRPGPGAWDADTSKSYVEFYKNLGNGQFEKTALFVKSGSAFYNIEVKDINGDGIDDIFLGSVGDGSTVLMGKASGSDIVYTEGGADMIAKFEAEIGNKNDAYEGGIGSINIVRGPDGKSYLVGTAKAYGGDQNNQTEKLYYSEITNAGVITLEASVAALQAMWPQLSVADAEQILALSGSPFAGGVVINLANAHNPIGQLLIPTRTGGFMMLSGSISGVDLTGATKMIATDLFNRDYGINMGSTLVDSENLWAAKTLDPTVDTSAALSLAQGIETVGDFKLSNSSDKQVALAYSGIRLSKNFGLQVSLVKLDKNPWLNMTGAWGSVTGATLSEFSGVYVTGKFTTRGGVLRTLTKFQPGLVTKVSPITAAWADVGFAVDKNLTVGGGVFPAVVAGNVTAEIPTSIDFNGKVNYTSVTADVNGPVVGYVRMNYSNQLLNQKNITYTVSAITSTTKTSSLLATVKIDF